MHLRRGNLLKLSNCRRHKYADTQLNQFSSHLMTILLPLQANQEVKKDLQKYVSEALSENKSAKDIIAEVKDFSAKYNLVEHELVTIVSAYLSLIVFYKENAKGRIFYVCRFGLL